MPIELQIQQLEDDIRNDLDLLKSYKDELRYETDPSLIGKYQRRIERLRESVAHNRQEYDELKKQVTGEPPAEMQDAVDLLQQMDAKLDEINERITDLRTTLLARFDDSEQAIISTIVQHLDQNQLATVQSILDEIEAHPVPESELQETLSAVLQALSEIKQNETGRYAPQLVSEAKNLYEVVDDPKLDVNHKLKVSLPIIPFILSYEAEVGLKSGLNLKSAWQRLKARVRGKG